MDSRFEVFGLEGRIQIDNLHRQPLQVVGPRGWSYPPAFDGDVADGHLAMLQHFVDCLRSGAPSRSEGEAGLAILAAVEAAVRSAVSGRREPVGAAMRAEVA
jgi:predicted dehydrogenase